MTTGGRFKGKTITYASTERIGTAYKPSPKGAAASPPYRTTPAK